MATVNTGPKVVGMNPVPAPSLPQRTAGIYNSWGYPVGPNAYTGGVGTATLYGDSLAGGCLPGAPLSTVTVEQSRAGRAAPKLQPMVSPQLDGILSEYGDLAGTYTDPYTGQTFAAFTQAMPEPVVQSEPPVYMMGQPSRILEALTGVSNIPIPCPQEHMNNWDETVAQNLFVPEGLTMAQVRAEVTRRAKEELFFTDPQRGYVEPFLDVHWDGYVGNTYVLREKVDTQTVTENDETNTLVRDWGTTFIPSSGEALPYVPTTNPELGQVRLIKAQDHATGTGRAVAELAGLAATLPTVPGRAMAVDWTRVNDRVAAAQGAALDTPTTIMPSHSLRAPIDTTTVAYQVARPGIDDDVAGSLTTIGTTAMPFRPAVDRAVVGASRVAVAGVEGPQSTPTAASARGPVDKSTPTLRAGFTLQDDLPFTPVHTTQLRSGLRQDVPAPWRGMDVTFDNEPVTAQLPAMPARDEFKDLGIAPGRQGFDGGEYAASMAGFPTTQTRAVNRTVAGLQPVQVQVPEPPYTTMPSANPRQAVDRTRAGTGRARADLNPDYTTPRAPPSAPTRAGNHGNGILSRINNAITDFVATLLPAAPARGAVDRSKVLTFMPYDRAESLAGGALRDEIRFNAADDGSDADNVTMQAVADSDARTRNAVNAAHPNALEFRAGVACYDTGDADRPILGGANTVQDLLWRAQGAAQWKPSLSSQPTFACAYESDYEEE
jgi:hypothetical protein